MTGVVVVAKPSIPNTSGEMTRALEVIGNMMDGVKPANDVVTEEILQRAADESDSARVIALADSSRLILNTPQHSEEIARGIRDIADQAIESEEFPESDGAVVTRDQKGVLNVLN